MSSSDPDTPDTPDSSPAITPKMEDYLRRIYHQRAALRTTSGFVGGSVLASAQVSD